MLPSYARHLSRCLPYGNRLYKLTDYSSWAWLQSPSKHTFYTAPGTCQLDMDNLTGHHKNMESSWTKCHRAILLHTHHGIHSIGLIDNIEDTGLVDWTSQKSQDLCTGHHRKYKTCGLHTTEDTEHMDWTTQDTGLVDWITKDMDLTWWKNWILQMDIDSKWSTEWS